MYSTDEVLLQLSAVGLKVSRNMLRQDVKAGYLPAPRRVSRGYRKGVGSLLEGWAARRAIYLYRLRRKGLQGSLLKVFLFLRDGWGWESIRPLCVTGLKKAVRAQKVPVRQHLRGQPTPESLEFLMEDLTNVYQAIDLVKLVLGMGYFGSPLPGGTFQPLVEGIQKVYGVAFEPIGLAKMEQAYFDSGLTWDQIIQLVNNADDAQAEKARMIFKSFVSWLRCLQQDYYAKQGISHQSTNPLTSCGRSSKELADGFRAFPGARLTTAQALAALIGVVAAVEPLHAGLTETMLDPSAE